MFEIIESTTKWEGRELTIKTGEIGRQAAGVVCVSYGGTVVLAAVTAQKDEDIERETSNCSGLGLITNFIAKYYAMGKIPGGFVKREGKLSEREVLASRVVDRAVRPLIDQNLLNEVNLTCKLLSYDTKVMPEVPALIAASAALGISGVPFNGPVVGVSLNVDQNNNTAFNQPENNQDQLNMLVACTKSSIVMVEAGAKGASEGSVVDGFSMALESAKPAVELVEEFCNSVKNKKPTLSLIYKNDALLKELDDILKDKIKEIFVSGIACKMQRHAKLSSLYSDAISDFVQKGYDKLEIKQCIKKIENSVARQVVLQNKVRIDGRNPDTIRQISIIPDYLKGTHGSALFTRGGTQSLVVTTLGSRQDEQVIDDFDGERRESVLLHYNFLPYAVGETGALRAPGRREIGHGRLALKGIKGVLPCATSLPYTVRIVSEITESDGSSSMATVCGASVALMDTGIPITKHVAGVAMGLVKNQQEYAVLTDISGDEDSLGDMDFKVAGTRDGITALQMDIKVDGISLDIIRDALNKALQGRLHILDKMYDAIESPRESVKDCAPKMLSYEIPADSVHKVIGSGGKTIKAICEESSSKIDIDANNIVHIMSETQEDLMSAKAKINAISGATPPKVGQVYNGKVTSVVDFGLFVSIETGQEGLVHISEIQKDRVHDIYSMHSEGDSVVVRVKEVARDGKIRLTMRLDEEDRITTTPRRESSAPGNLRSARSRQDGQRKFRHGDSNSARRSSSYRRDSAGSRKRFF